MVLGVLHLFLSYKLMVICQAVAGCVGNRNRQKVVGLGFNIPLKRKTSEKLWGMAFLNNTRTTYKTIIGFVTFGVLKAVTMMSTSFGM
jgi:hypothetical protein